MHHLNKTLGIITAHYSHSDIYDFFNAIFLYLCHSLVIPEMTKVTFEYVWWSYSYSSHGQC